MASLPLSVSLHFLHTRKVQSVLPSLSPSFCCKDNLIWVSDMSYANKTRRIPVNISLHIFSKCRRVRENENNSRLNVLSLSQTNEKSHKMPMDHSAHHPVLCNYGHFWSDNDCPVYALELGSLLGVFFPSCCKQIWGGNIYWLSFNIVK